VAVGFVGFMGIRALTGGGSHVAQTHTPQATTKDSNYHFVSFVLDDTQSTWQSLFDEANLKYRRSKLVLYAGRTRTGCGTGAASMGPFYCPSDRGIYIDTDFYAEMDKQMDAGGDFARAYVIAHEYGHHIQNLTGLSEKVQSTQQRDPSRANQMSVKLELQADCYAGVWAALNKDRIEPGDVEEGMRAAHQIGDDTLMKAAGRTPVEQAFTHGSSEQRMQWLRKGLETGDPGQCDTFA
jgi:predicted metalloprotease